MSNILTKKIQSQISDYILSVDSMTKPETRCLKDMMYGILKSQSVFINQIAGSLKEKLKLKDICKRLSAQYLKEDFAQKVLKEHLSIARQQVHSESFVILDKSDITKEYACCMEGLDRVKDGDKDRVKLGYNLINVIAVDKDNEIIPLYSQAYSYEMGAKSSNQEIKTVTRKIKEVINPKSCWVIDREADQAILSDFFTLECEQCIVRLKQNTKLRYKGESLKMNQIAQKVKFSYTQTIVKIKKNKKSLHSYDIGIVPVERTTAKGKRQDLWLVVSRNHHGGLCYLLVKTTKKDLKEIALWAFSGYGKRWQIEEYHRHVKQEYKLEKIQIKTFTGLQSVLAILMCTTYILYRKIQSIHIDLLLDSGYNYLNKHNIAEITNFIYYKISKIVSNLLIPVKALWKINYSDKVNQNQMQILFN